PSEGLSEVQWATVIGKLNTRGKEKHGVIPLYALKGLGRLNTLFFQPVFQGPIVLNKHLPEVIISLHGGLNRLHDRWCSVTVERVKRVKR
ncbi:MAG: hypothetical protein O3C36_07075, partial [archaeon]|nr:hypothetical protein [archaeon]